MSGACVQAPWHGVLDTVWLLSTKLSKLDVCKDTVGRLSAGVGPRHPVTIRKALLMAGVSEAGVSTAVPDRSAVLCG